MGPPGLGIPFHAHGQLSALYKNPLDASSRAAASLTHTGEMERRQTCSGLRYTQKQ